MSPYCSDCGAQVRQMDSYCWQCGSELEFGDTGSTSTRRGDRSGASEPREKAAEDDGESAFSFGDTGGPEEDASRGGVAETEGYVGGDGDHDGGDERDIYGSGGEDRHSYEEEDEGRHYAEEPEPREPNGSGFGDDVGEEHEQRSPGMSETDSLDSEIERIDETPGSPQEVERSEPPWKETDSSDLEASGSVSEDRPRYVRQDSDGGAEASASPESGSTAVPMLAVSLAVIGALVAAVAHDQVREITALAPMVGQMLPTALADDPGLLTRVRTAGLLLAALGAVVAVVGRYRT